MTYFGMTDLDIDDQLDMTHLGSNFTEYCFLKVMPFVRGGVFYKGDTFWPKWRLLLKWRPLTGVVLFIKMTPFDQGGVFYQSDALWPGWCLL